jgi:hypothetical protein
VTARGKNLLKDGRDECAQSERATYLCLQEWRGQSAGATELLSISQSKMEEICEHLDQLSSHWSNLEIGQSMAVAWPDLNILWIL